MNYILKFFLALVVLVSPAIVFAAANTTGNASLVPGPGSLNMNPNGEGVTVTETGLTGYAWGDQFGWVNFNPQDYGVNNTCNPDGSMTLGGYAWGQNAGWINFEVTDNPITIDSDGNFSGHAWSQNFGWINFDGVTTTFQCSINGGGNNGGGGSSTSSGSMVIPQTPPVSQSPIIPQSPTLSTPSISSISPVVQGDNPVNPPEGEFPPNEATSEENTPRGDELQSLSFPVVSNAVSNTLNRWMQVLSDALYGTIEALDFQEIGVTVAGLGLLGGLLHLPFRINNILLAIPSFMRRRKSWGTVYDSQTYEPLDPAYIQLFDTAGNEVAAMITDLDGRYGFLVEPGTYTLRAGKTNYTFPSVKKAGQSSDRFYQDLYFGEPVVITQRGQVITKDIPMDPSGNDWNQAEKRRMNVARFFKRNDLFIHRIIDVLLFAGFAYSVYALILSQTVFNIGMIAVYLVTVAISLVGVPSRAFGSVTLKDGSPAAGCVVKLFNPTLNKEMLHRVVGKNGYYYALTQSGEYYATVEKLGNAENSEILEKTEVFTSRDGIIKKNIKV